MRIVYVNPNSTEAMTSGIVSVAQAELPNDEIIGVTNADGPPAIQGPEDGDAAVPGVLAAVRANPDANAIVIGCFDDTGLAEAQAEASCPVLGIGQASYLMAALLGKRFAVVTSLDVSVPVIEANIARGGFADACSAVTASGLPVLTIDEGSEDTRAALADHISRAQGDVVVLGCAGMAPLRADLEERTGVTLIDGVAASAHLAKAAAAYIRA
ncbi:aspartate/glutamate racemase family protein [Marivivens aquimaris]|uniref:aspartate/glutamate racemase family protein n=1 Tax=Marivivens aquimaris TaxID=2774876 RepID=UPI00187FD01B|nr:aspartate/glutamate racemase family protein [Marivivens aquimaris]